MRPANGAVICGARELLLGDRHLGLRLRERGIGHLHRDLRREVVLVGDAAGLQQAVGALLLGLRHGRGWPRRRRARPARGRARAGSPSSSSTASSSPFATRAPSSLQRRASSRAATSATTCTWARGRACPVSTTSSSRSRCLDGGGAHGDAARASVAAASGSPPSRRRARAAAAASSRKASCRHGVPRAVRGQRQACDWRRAGPGPSRSAARRARWRGRGAPRRG